METKEVYRDDADIRRNWRVVRVTYEVNGNEYHNDIVIKVEEPIVSIQIELLDD